MKKEMLKKRIDVAAGRVLADLVIKNCNVVNVYTGEIRQEDIAVSDGVIAGLGSYEGITELDASGSYAIPGLIESHIHIESAFVTPEEIGRLLVPRGTTTIIADPHEIVNVCGIKGMEYMLDAAKNTVLDIRYMMPSCVPSTFFEHGGAVIEAEDMREILQQDRVLGLGEFMNYPGVIAGVDRVLDKLIAAEGKLVDGHCPNLEGKELNAYAAAGIHTDHECSTVKEMEERLRLGMYVLLRQGSACHNLKELLQGVTEQNSRRCLLCSDDRQPKTIFTEGHIDSHLRTCVEEGLDAVTAIRMATLNAAECFRLFDRGAIAPGLMADIVLVKDLKQFQVEKVVKSGRLVAQNGAYLLPVERKSIASVSGSFQVKDFGPQRLKLHLNTAEATVIDLIPGGVVTAKGQAKVKVGPDGDFLYDPEQDIVKMAVIERHHGTGNVGVGLLRGYGIRQGAVALSIAHDSHNIIAVGISNQEIACAVDALIAQRGGVVLVKDGKVLEQMPLPVAGIMSDQSGEWVDGMLTRLQAAAFEKLGVSREIEPLMTLCFMALPVIPEVKLTDMGLFDVTQFQFIPVAE